MDPMVWAPSAQAREGPLDGTCEGGSCRHAACLSAIGMQHVPTKTVGHLEGQRRQLCLGSLPLHQERECVRQRGLSQFLWPISFLPLGSAAAPQGLATLLRKPPLGLLVGCKPVSLGCC